MVQHYRKIYPEERASAYLQKALDVKEFLFNDLTRVFGLSSSEFTKLISSDKKGNTGKNISDPLKP